jgi:hypothetical protein
MPWHVTRPPQGAAQQTKAMVFIRRYDDSGETHRSRGGHVGKRFSLPKFRGIADLLSGAFIGVGMDNLGEISETNQFVCDSAFGTETNRLFGRSLHFIWSAQSERLGDDPLWSLGTVTDEKPCDAQGGSKTDPTRRHQFMRIRRHRFRTMSLSRPRPIEREASCRCGRQDALLSPLSFAEVDRAISRRSASASAFRAFKICRARLESALSHNDRPFMWFTYDKHSKMMLPSFFRKGRVRNLRAAMADQ